MESASLVVLVPEASMVVRVFESISSSLASPSCREARAPSWSIIACGETLIKVWVSGFTQVQPGIQKTPIIKVRVSSSSLEDLVEAVKAIIDVVNSIPGAGIVMDE